MKKLVHDVITNEKTLIDLTPEEIAENLAEAQKETELQNKLFADMQERQAAKNLIYEKLGLTDDEARLLLS